MNDFKNLYEEKYFSQRDLIDPRRMASFEQERLLLEKFVSRDGVICDIGCSTGEFLEAVAWSGQRYGMEISEYAAAKAEKRRIRFDKNILNQTDFFDVIVFRGTIQHLPEPFLYMRKSFSALKRGGHVFFLMTPNANSIYYKLFNTLPMLDDRLNFFIPSDLTLTNALRNFGFEIVAVEYPYWGSPYASPLADHCRFLKKALLRTDDKFAFWKNAMNVVGKKA